MWGGSGVGRWGGWGVGQVAATGRELQLMRKEDLKPSQHYNLLQLRISSSLNPPKNRKVVHHYFSVNLLLGMTTNYKPSKKSPHALAKDQARPDQAPVPRLDHPETKKKKWLWVGPYVQTQIALVARSA